MFKPLARLSRVPAFPHQFIRPQLPSIRIQSPIFQSRKMSTAPKEFLCILPDKPGVHAKRMEVRP